MLAESPADLAERCSIVFFMLASDAVAERVFNDIKSARKQAGLIVADCSTNAPPTAAKLESAGWASDPQITYLACPVFGRPDAVRCVEGIDIACDVQAHMSADVTGHASP